MEQRGIENVIVMGVHGNMCVLGRPFAIRQMVAQGKNVLLMRDLIDTMYNSRKAPYVSHFAGTDLLVEHIEKYWCPSITSVDFLGGEPFRFRADKRPRIVFVIGENEYHTWETLPEFARNELEWRGYNCSFVTASPDVKDNVFTNFNVIKDADLLFVSARRRTPPKEMMDLIRAHLDAGKPLVGIRTACHAFAADPADAQHEGWPTFDVDVLGCNYQNHYGNSGTNAAPTYVRTVPGANPILTGLPTDELEIQGSLYKSRNPAATVTPLMTGHLASGSEIEPVAWINTAHNRRVFYTSLGTPDNFKQPFFRELLLNGISWALDRPIPPELVARPKARRRAVQHNRPNRRQRRDQFPPAASRKFKRIRRHRTSLWPLSKSPTNWKSIKCWRTASATACLYEFSTSASRLWVVEYLHIPQSCRPKNAQSRQRLARGL